MDESRRCTAHLSDGSGRRCRKAAVRGATVCATHGGSAGQVKKAAADRLRQLAEPAIAGLAIALKNAINKQDWPQVISAARTILDRAGYGPGSSLRVDADITADVTHTDGRAPLDALSPNEQFLALHLMARAAANLGNAGAHRQVESQRQRYIETLDLLLHRALSDALPVALDAAPAPSLPSGQDAGGVIEAEVVEESP